MIKNFHTCTAYRAQFIHFFAFLYIVSSLRMKLDSKWRWFYHPSSPYHSIRVCEKLIEFWAACLFFSFENRISVEFKSSLKKAIKQGVFIIIRSPKKWTKMKSAGQFRFSCHWSFLSIYYSKWSQNEGKNQIVQRVDSVLVHFLENLTAIKVLTEILAPFITLLVPLKNILHEGL